MKRYIVSQGTLQGKVWVVDTRCAEPDIYCTSMRAATEQCAVSNREKMLKDADLIPERDTPYRNSSAGK